MPGSKKPMTMATRFPAGDGGGLLEQSVLADLPAGYAVPCCPRAAPSWLHIAAT